MRRNERMKCKAWLSLLLAVALLTGFAFAEEAPLAEEQFAEVGEVDLFDPEIYDGEAAVEAPAMEPEEAAIDETVEEPSEAVTEEPSEVAAEEEGPLSGALMRHRRVRSCSMWR